MFQFVLNNVRILTTIFVTIYLPVSIFFDAKLCRPRQPRYTQLYHIFLIYRYIVHRDVLEFAVRWSDRMQWTKITRQTVHDAMTGNDNDARYRKGRRYIYSPLVRCMRECSSGKTVSERSLAVELLLKALV